MLAKEKNMKSGSRVRSKDEFRFKLITYPILLIFTVICLYPFLIIISGSVASNSSVIKYGFSLWPREFSLDAYRYIFASPAKILNAYKVTIEVTVIGTFLALLSTTTAGYVLNRSDLKYRNAIAMFLYISTLFSGGLMPTYIFYTQVLHLKNSIWALIVGGIVSPFNIILMRNFMRAIPNELIEAAQIDGAGDWKIFYDIVLPLSKAGIATIGLFVSLGYWNSWIQSQLYITKSDLYTLMYYLNTVLNQASNAQAGSESAIAIQLPGETVKMAMAVVATGPLVLIYPFVQRYFVTGITVGAVKG